MAHITAAVKAKDGTVLAHLNPFSLSGRMIADGLIDRLDFHGFGDIVIMSCNLSGNNMTTTANTGDVTVTLTTANAAEEYIRIKDHCSVQQLFSLFQFTLHKYTSDQGILWNVDQT